MILLRLLKWLTQPQPAPLPHASGVDYEIVERTEHRSLVRVRSQRGTFEYWVPNEPLGVTFTSEGVKADGR